MIKDIDLIWLEANYPGLIYFPEKNILHGCLWFKMVYYPASGMLVIEPNETTSTEDGILIEDAYELDFCLDNIHSEVVVRETAGRILRTKEKWKFKELADVHMYSDGILCLCPKPEEKIRLPNGFNIRDFIKRLVIPYLYYQSYLEKYGKEPWKSSSHGDLGLLESYMSQFSTKTPPKDIVKQYVESLTLDLKNTIVGNKRYKDENLCLCGSNRFFKNCHKEAFEGYKKLLSDYR